MDDEEMVRLALAGDRPAFERLGVRMDQQLKSFFRARFPHDVAAELAQRTAHELLEKFAERKNLPTQSVYGWVLAFALTQIKRWFDTPARERRRAQLRGEYAQIMPLGQALNENTYGAEEQLDLMTQIIEELPDKLRGVYKAYLLGDCHAEIAEAFDIAEGTARSRVMVAKRRVAKSWESKRLTRTTFRTKKTGS